MSVLEWYHNSNDDNVFSDTTVQTYSVWLEKMELISWFDKYYPRSIVHREFDMRESQAVITRFSGSKGALMVGYE